MSQIDFVLRGEWIALDALLKATGVASSGGAAKTLIQIGSVHVDGEPETRRTKKLGGGQVVQVGTQRIHIVVQADQAQSEPANK